MEPLTNTEQYVLAQLLVSGNLDEGEFRQMSDMNRTVAGRALAGLREKGLVGPDGIRENPFDGYARAKIQQ